MGSRPDDAEIQAGDLNVLTRGLSGFVPRAVARRAVAIAVETPRDEYELGESIEITVTLRNRIPFPIEVPTTGLRLWGWRVDGLLEASDERVYEPREPRSFTMQARERRTFEVEWDGRIKREGTPTRWEPAGRGTHRIEAFLAVEPKRTDETTIEIR